MQLHDYFRRNWFWLKRSSMSSANWSWTSVFVSSSSSSTTLSRASRAASWCGSVMKKSRSATFQLIEIIYIVTLVEHKMRLIKIFTYIARWSAVARKYLHQYYRYKKHCTMEKLYSSEMEQDIEIEKTKKLENHLQNNENFMSPAVWSNSWADEKNVKKRSFRSDWFSRLSIFERPQVNL